jgi:hypothetical protein
MRLKTIIALNVALFISFIVLGLYQWQFDQQQLASTRWACVQLEENFVTQGSSGYQEIATRSILEFTSDKTLLIFQKGHLKTEAMGINPYEVYFEADYTAQNGLLSVAYHHIDWDLKPADSGSFVRGLNALVRAKIELMYKVHGDHLFLFSKGNAEERNDICYKK